MSGADEDDKPTVVLDLNALKKQKQKQEEDLANIASELEFNIPPESMAEATDSEDFAEQFLESRDSVEDDNLAVILFDFGNNFFEQSKEQFPMGFEYNVVTTVSELNQCLKSKNFQIVVFNYDGNPKAVNQLCAQIKAKKPNTKTIIMARAISPEKAKAHSKTTSGADGYYQLPLDTQKIEKEFQKIQNLFKKVS